MAIPGRGIYASGRGESGQTASPAALDAFREQVERIIADPLFRNSKRYSGLLKFVVERSLDGRQDELKERIIGIEVFGRSPDYDTSLDATVRVAANEVRKRLALYYKEPGRELEFRIDLPSGSYMPEFRLPDQALQEPKALPEIPAQKPPVWRRRQLWYVASAATVVILALAVWAVPRAMSHGAVIDQFWAPVLNGTGPVILYLSAPSSATANAAQSSLSVPADPGKRFHEYMKMSRGQLPVADVIGASVLSSYLQHKGKQSVVRPADGAALSDLRAAHAILLGSYYNEWVMRLGSGMRFRFRRESEQGLRWIEDSANPENRSWAMDLSAPYGQVDQDYALISRVLDPTAGQWLIMISGLTGSGTSAACEVVTDPTAMAMFRAHLPKNWESKNLQAVIGVKLVKGSPGASRVIATYSW